MRVAMFVGVAVTVSVGVRAAGRLDFLFLAADFVDVLVRAVVELDVDKRPQASVLAKIAARVFVPRLTVFDFANRIEADERGAHAVLPETHGLGARADRARFAAMLVDDNFRLLVGRAEAAANEVHFRLYDRKIVLRAALQDEA